MRRDNLAFSILLLCAGLLLPLNSASAQTAQTQDLPGTYTLNDPGASKTIKEKIDEAVKGIGILVRGSVRNELKKTNLPPSQQITISFAPGDVTITTDQSGLIQTSSSGDSIDWTRKDGEKFQVSTKLKIEKIERTFKNAKGQRVNTYSIGGDGKTLTVDVNLTSSWLKRPLTYTLVYRRVTR
jgi:hypothetical protein